MASVQIILQLSNDPFKCVRILARVIRESTEGSRGAICFNLLGSIIMKGAIYKRALMKVWLLFFVCQATGAIYFNMLHDYGTNTFNISIKFVGLLVTLSEVLLAHGWKDSPLSSTPSGSTGSSSRPRSMMAPKFSLCLSTPRRS